MDFNFRQYDPQIGRFLSVDPLAAAQGQDKYSPYTAMNNQPESMTDPNGLLAFPNARNIMNPWNDQLSYRNPALSSMPTASAIIEQTFGYGRILGKMAAAFEEYQIQLQKERDAEASGGIPLYVNGVFVCNLAVGGGGSSAGDWGDKGGDGNRPGKGPVGPFSDYEDTGGEKQQGSSAVSSSEEGNGNSKPNGVRASVVHQVGEKWSQEFPLGEKVSFKGYVSYKNGESADGTISMVFFNGKVSGAKYSYGPLSTTVGADGVITNSLTLGSYTFGRGSDGTYSLGYSTSYNANLSNGVSVGFRPGGTVFLGVLLMVAPEASPIIIPAFAR